MGLPLHAHAHTDTWVHAHEHTLSPSLILTHAHQDQPHLAPVSCECLPTCLVLRSFGCLLEPCTGQEPELLHTEQPRSFHYSDVGAVASLALKWGPWPQQP